MDNAWLLVSATFLQPISSSVLESFNLLVPKDNYGRSIIIMPPEAPHSPTDAKTDAHAGSPSFGEIWADIVNVQKKDSGAYFAKLQQDATALSSKLVDQNILPALELFGGSKEAIGHAGSDASGLKSMGGPDDTAGKSKSTDQQLQSHSNDKLGFNTFAADRLQQGKYGDCFLVAAADAVAGGPDGSQKFKDMIEDNHDGSYVVTFPGDTIHPVSVNQDELTKYATSDRAQWANVIETAFLKMDQISPDASDDQKAHPNGPITSPLVALELLTGEAGNLDEIGGPKGSSKSTIEQDIERSLENGEPITATSDLVPKGKRMPGKDGIYYPKAGSNSPLVGDHQFAIEAYDTQTHTVTLRNPWGTDYQTPDLSAKGQKVDGVVNLGEGEISMSLDTFTKHFQEIDYLDKTVPTIVCEAT
jgi:Calpain family cysteine protease